MRYSSLVSIMKVLFVYLAKRTDNLKLMSPAPLTHPLLAAYTPPDIDVSIVDEAFETIDYDQDVDLVATTCVLPLAHRAYRLAREFRKIAKHISSTFATGQDYPHCFR